MGLLLHIIKLKIKWRQQFYPYCCKMSRTSGLAGRRQQAKLFCQPPRDIRGGMTHADSRVEAPLTRANFPGNRARLPGWKEVRSAGRSALGARDMKEGDHNHRYKQSQNTFLISLFCASTPALSFCLRAVALKSTQTELSRSGFPDDSRRRGSTGSANRRIAYVHLSELPSKKCFRLVCSTRMQRQQRGKKKKKHAGLRCRQSVHPITFLSFF